MVLHYRYSFRHNLLRAVQRRSRDTFDRHTMLPYRARLTTDTHSFGIMHSPLNYRRKVTRLVICYELFK